MSTSLNRVVPMLEEVKMYLKGLLVPLQASARPLAAASSVLEDKPRRMLLRLSARVMLMQLPLVDFTLVIPILLSVLPPALMPFLTSMIVLPSMEGVLRGILTILLLIRHR